MGIVNKKELVEYIKKHHFEFKGYEISPIKLQKTLYFLYANWAGYVESAKITFQGSPVTEATDIAKLNSELFEPNFEAWAYGPVDREVYYDFNRSTLINGKLAESAINSLMKENIECFNFIDVYSKRLFNTSDFGLVDLSHRDECWIKNFDGSMFKPIKGSEIVEEYVKKYTSNKVS